jgi:Sulfotransferase family
MKTTAAEVQTSAPDVVATARAAGRKIPDFWIVGNPKSGTTALHQMLRTHPDIYMPELKEPRFFARELYPRMRSKRHPNSMEQYLALFAQARPDQRAGEASPSYLRSRMAAQRIAELEPRARIIAILREPADFLRSMHLELLKDHNEIEKDLRKAIAREQRLRDSKPVLSYSDERVEYTAQVRRYHEAFGEDQVLVLIYDDYRADAEGTVRRVLRFLDVDETLPIARSEANRSVAVRSPRAYEMMRSLYLGRGAAARAIGAGIKVVTSRRIRHAGLGTVRKRMIFGKPPPPDEELMLELRCRFKPYVVELSEYLGRDLVGLWGYDRIA